jgi:putative transposase
MEAEVRRLEASDAKRLKDVELQFIQSDKTTQNSTIERFNRTYCTEVLDAYLFSSMQEIRTVTEASQHKYNHFRPHGSLNDMAPRV